MQANLPPISEIWVYLSGSPLLALVLTLSAYLLGLTLYERSDRNPLANPVLIAVILVTLSINVLDMPYVKYFEGAQFVHFLLGTATVSLAIPIYKGFASLKGRMGILMLAPSTSLQNAALRCASPDSRAKPLSSKVEHSFFSHAVKAATRGSSAREVMSL